MKVWFTIAGTRHHHGQDFMEKGMTVTLEKEPDNEHDREAIKVNLEGLGLVGYVANSPWTPPRLRCSTFWTRASCAGRRPPADEKAKKAAGHTARPRSFRRDHRDRRSFPLFM